MNVWPNMISHEQAIMGLESRAVSAWVTKHFVTIFSKRCNIGTYQQYASSHSINMHG